jgi:hypothetical protein
LSSAALPGQRFAKIANTRVPEPNVLTTIPTDQPIITSQTVNIATEIITDGIIKEYTIDRPPRFGVIITNTTEIITDITGTVIK